MSKPLVSIKCLVYNHEPYLRQCLDGFVMQKTNFPFEAIVHDDASTDHSADIIREYAEKYPDIIKPIYETENQWSKHDGSLKHIMNDACSGKYIALCEGDDFWIDPQKLQRQVNILEAHPSYTMCYNRTKHYSDKKGKYIGENRSYNKNQIASPNDIILKGGEFVPTCSIIYRKDIESNMPVFYTQCYIGDYPLQILSALKGEVFYIDKIMSVYRMDNQNSWTSKAQIIDKHLTEELILQKKTVFNMLVGFACKTESFRNILMQRAYYTLSSSINRRTNRTTKKAIYKVYEKDIKNAPFLWKIDFFIRIHLSSCFIGIYTKSMHFLYFKKFTRKNAH